MALSHQIDCCFDTMISKPLPEEDIVAVFEQTSALWMEARGKKFFITGGTGFFGMWLLESFTKANDALDLGMSATVLTRSKRAFEEKAPWLAQRRDLGFFEGDIKAGIFPKGKFDYVIHAAAEVSDTLSSDDILDTIILGTKNLLKFVDSSNVKKLLFVSSGAVYGRQADEVTRIEEDYLGAPDPLLVSSAYGEGKRVAEHMVIVHSERHGYEAKIGRCFAFVGPYLPLDSRFAIGNFIWNVVNSKPIQIRGGGEAIRSYLYAGDLAAWLWTILFKGTNGRAYNVGSDKEISIKQLAMLIERISASELPVVFGSSDGTGSVSRYVPSVMRARSELGLEEGVSLEEGIMKTLKWHSYNENSN